MFKNITRQLGRPFFTIVAKLKIDGLIAKLLRGMSVSFLLVISGTVVGFLQRLVLARAMSIEMYGTYTYVFSWLALLTVISVAGWDTAAIRFTASYYGQAVFATLKTFWQHSYRRVLFTSAAISLLTVLVVWSLRLRLGPNMAITFGVMCLTLLLVPLLNLTGQNLIAIGSITMGVGPNVLFVKLFLLIAVFLWWRITGEQLGSAAVMLINLLIVGGLLGLSALVFLRHVNNFRQIEASQPNEQEPKTEWNKTARELNGLAILRIVTQQIDIILVGTFLGTIEAGIYGTAALIAGLMGFGLQSLNFIVAPMIADLYKKEQLNELQKVLRIGASITALYVVLMGGAILVSGRLILRIFDPIFVTGYSTMLVLILGQSVNSLAGSVNNLLTMTGRQKISMLVLLSSAIVNISLSMVLIPKWGMIGAAWAKTTAMTAWNIIMYIYIKRKMGLDPTILSINGLVRQRDEHNG